MTQTIATTAHDKLHVLGQRIRDWQDRIGLMTKTYRRCRDGFVYLFLCEEHAVWALRGKE